MHTQNFFNAEHRHTHFNIFYVLNITNKIFALLFLYRFLSANLFLTVVNRLYFWGPQKKAYFKVGQQISISQLTLHRSSAV
ncbi:hypothetical protein M5D96_009846 [Drosophila gunungcola]|uniref:Uncharacterized protein n=1 Tax=Drosophila gunungcola TaxID=103775 RepID=A0A9Q0BMJ8_9MUSC|nr:hypothetical protein M5D96_009846 [Drosophila gunungcola]